MNYKHISKFTGILLTVILYTSFSHAQSAGEKDKRTVVDYVELIRGEKTVENEDFKILVKDTKNGYLKILDDGVEVTVALFRTADGSAIILVAMRYCGDVACNSAMDAYEMIDGEMFDVSKVVLPRLSDREAIEIFKQKRRKRVKPAEEISLVYQLPRKGKGVKIVGLGEDKKRIKLYELHLKGNKFVLVR